MTEFRSELSPGHIIVLVENIKTSVSFYQSIGLQPYMQLETLAIIELRGGTHLIIAEQGSQATQGLTPSRYGGQKKDKNENFDFMIKGHTQHDLDQFRTSIVAKGVAVTEIQEADFSHFTCSLTDPDGNNIFIYTSHEIKYMS